jgi:hypothetical protein
MRFSFVFLFFSILLLCILKTELNPVLLPTVVGRPNAIFNALQNCEKSSRNSASKQKENGQDPVGIEFLATRQMVF